MINNLINNSSQAGIRIKEPHDTAVWAGFEILPFEIENLVHSGQQVTETRLTYNCAHLRLNNKKNENKSGEGGDEGDGGDGAQWANLVGEAI